MPNRNSGSLSFLATALLSVLPRLASGANATSPVQNIDESGGEGCGFMHTQPRFYQLLAGLTLQNVALPDTLVNDALIRTLRGRLMVSECQIILSEGVPCTSGTQELPCADPVHLCPSSASPGSTGAGRVVLTDDVYDAIVTESCDSNGDGLVDMLDGTTSTLVCGQVLEFGTAVQTLVRQGACTAVCDVNSLVDGSGAELEGNPISAGSSCLSFDLTLNLATEQAALGLQGELLSAGTSNAVEAGLSGFGSDPLAFSVVESTISDTVGFGFFPPPPPPPPPLLELVEGTPTSDRTSASSKTVEYGQWSPCYPICGDGISTRTVTCVAPDGAVLPLAECPEALAVESSKSCSTACELPYWRYGPWQTCDRRCGTGQSTRTAVCVSDGDTKCAAEDKEPLDRECNTLSCEIFAWIQSPWSECSASCDGGMQSRNVTCVGPDGSEAPESSCDPSTMPSTSSVCNSIPCDFCQATACLGRGTCSEGRCECTGGYGGAHCEAHSSCGTGVVAANLACCSSGVLDTRGGCCAEGASVDAVGECCDGTVDACGVCNGSGKYVDIQGQCCAVVDADGICCASGLIDECGVCNGVGNTCSIVLGLNMRVPNDIVADGNVQPATIDAYLDLVANTTGISPDRLSVGDVALASGSTVSPGSGRKLLQSPNGGYTNLLVEVEIAPNVNRPSEVPFSSAYYAQLLPEASSQLNSEEFAIEAVPLAARKGVCGNDICEVGERTTESNEGVYIGTCPEDCGLPSKACPGGCGTGGVCLPASGVCQCRDEYTGSSCGECAPGYSRSGDSSTCVTNVADLGIISGSVLGPNGEALVSGTDSSGGTSAGVIVGAVFGALIGTALIILAAVLIRRRCMYGRRKKQFVSNELYQERPESSDASDLGLRKKYGLAPHTFGYSDGCEPADQIGVGQYDFSHENPMYNGAFGGGNQQDDPEHRVMYVSGATVDPTSSDQNSGFVRELYVKDPSPDRIQMKLAQHEPQLSSEEHSAYIKAAQMPQVVGMDGQDVPVEDEEIFPAQSLEQLSPNTRRQNLGCYADDRHTFECESVGPESRMVFNPAFSIHGEAPRWPDEYPKTVDADHHGGASEMRDLDARREKLNALRAVVRSLENSRAPSRETSFTDTALDSENMVDLDSIAGRTLPPKPDGVPELALPRPTGRPATHAPPEKEASSFFETVKRALTPPRFRRPISAAESNDESNQVDLSRSSMGSFTKVLMEVDDALKGRETNATKKTTFDATNL